jgi:hypothetical protein
VARRLRRVDRARRMRRVSAVETAVYRPLM